MIPRQSRVHIHASSVEISLGEQSDHATMGNFLGCVGAMRLVHELLQSAARSGIGVGELVWAISVETGALRWREPRKRRVGVQPSARGSAPPGDQRRGFSRSQAATLEQTTVRKRYAYRATRLPHRPSDRVGTYNPMGVRPNHPKKGGPMPRRHRPSPGYEVLSRNVAISTLTVHVRMRVDQRRGEGPEVDAGPWLELRGSLDEPLGGVQDVLFSLYPEGDLDTDVAGSAGIGSVIRLKPRMDVVVPSSHRDFDRLWGLALSGRLTFAHLAVTKPYYGRARVVAASFSNEREE